MDDGYGSLGDAVGINGRSCFMFPASNLIRLFALLNEKLTPGSGRHAGPLSARCCCCVYSGAQTLAAMFKRREQPSSSSLIRAGPAANAYNGLVPSAPVLCCAVALGGNGGRPRMGMGKSQEGRCLGRILGIFLDPPKSLSLGESGVKVEAEKHPLMTSSASPCIVDKWGSMEHFSYTRTNQ